VPGFRCSSHEGSSFVPYVGTHVTKHAAIHSRYNLQLQVHLFPAVLTVSAFVAPVEWQSWVTCRRNCLQLWNVFPEVLNKHFPMKEKEESSSLSIDLARKS